MSRTTMAIATLIASSTLPPATATAQPADEASAWFQRGKALHAVGDTAGAYQAYLRSHQLRPSYDAAGNAAQHASKLGRWSESCNLASYSRAHLPSSMSTEKRATVGQTLDGLLQQSLRHVGRLRVETADGATITVDSSPAGKVPLDPPSYCVSAGTHTVRATLTGHEPATTTVMITPGETFVVRLPLSLSVAIPGDGTPTGTAADAGTGPDAGVVIALSAVAAVGAGVGIWLLVAAGNKSDDANANLAILGGGSCIAGGPGAQLCDAIISDQDDATTLQGGAIAALAIGGAAGVGALMYGLWPREEAEPSVTVVPTFGPHVAGVFIGGVW